MTLRNGWIQAALPAVAVLTLVVTARAQAPAGAAPGPAPAQSVVVANPTYTSILMETTVNRPVAEVWQRIGKYCDIGSGCRSRARSRPARTARSAPCGPSA